MDKNREIKMDSKENILAYSTTRDFLIISLLILISSLLGLPYIVLTQMNFLIIFIKCLIIVLILAILVLSIMMFITFNGIFKKNKDFPNFPKNF